MTKKNGFLDILDEELSKNFSYDYEINWDKAHHAVELSFILFELTDEEEPDENFVYEDGVLFYDPEKTDFDPENYLITIPYDKQGLSREFIEFFVQFLQKTADRGLADLMDFLETDEEEFTIKFDQKEFDKGDERLIEREFFPYPRY